MRNRLQVHWNSIEDSLTDAVTNNGELVCDAESSCDRRGFKV